MKNFKLAVLVSMVALACVSVDTFAFQTDCIIAEVSGLENTERNARDQSGKTLTPVDQKENDSDSDIYITANIRKELMADESLSLNAQNIKIITQGGIVMLRGPVETKAESNKLQKIAETTPGVKKIYNSLEVKAP